MLKYLVLDFVYVIALLFSWLILLTIMFYPLNVNDLLILIQSNGAGKGGNVNQKVWKNRCTLLKC